MIAGAIIEGNGFNTMADGQTRLNRQTQMIPMKIKYGFKPSKNDSFLLYLGNNSCISETPAQND